MNFVKRVIPFELLAFAALHLPFLPVDTSAETAGGASAPLIQNDWVIRQQDFAAMSPTDKSNYLDLVFRILDRAESKSYLPSCIIGGDVFPKLLFRNYKSMTHQKLCYSTALRESERGCDRRNIRCAPIFGVSECVPFDVQTASSYYCYKLSPDPKAVARIFGRPELIEKWQGIKVTINQFCRKENDDHCLSLLKHSSMATSRAKKARASRFSSWLIFFSLGRDARAESCSYDKETQTFGADLHLRFAPHSIPRKVMDFFQIENPTLDQVRTLVQAHADDMNEMRNNFDVISNLIRERKINWIGHEGSSSNFEAIGGERGLYGLIKSKERSIISTGASKIDIINKLIILYGSSLTAWYIEMKSNDGKFDPAHPRIIPIDNKRASRIDELNDSLNRLLNTTPFPIEEYDRLKAEKDKLESSEFIARDLGMSRELLDATQLYGPG